MAINRRDFLTGSTIGLASALWTCPTSLARGVDHDRLLLTAARKSNGRFALFVLTLDGNIVREIPLSGRGHDFAIHEPSGTVVSFARRPGRFALLFNPRDFRQPLLFAPPPNRHFYGHGAFSHDGKLLYSTENDFDAARGIIGVYDATNQFARIGEVSSHGVGPHDIVLLRDGKTLVVANGGIETHPDSGREKLNIDTMEPSLCFIDVKTGDLIARHTLSSELHKLSIRHLACGSDDTVWFGCQWQGSLDNAPTLIGHAHIDSPVEFIDGAALQGPDLNGYIGSVALSSDSRWLAASAPRAGRIVYIDTQSASRTITTKMNDGCGVAAASDSTFLVTSGLGVIRAQTPPKSGKNLKTNPDLAFDNHMRFMQ